MGFPFVPTTRTARRLRVMLCIGCAVGKFVVFISLLRVSVGANLVNFLIIASRNKKRVRIYPQLLLLQIATFGRQTTYRQAMTPDLTSNALSALFSYLVHPKFYMLSLCVFMIRSICLHRLQYQSRCRCRNERQPHGRSMIR